MPNLTQPEIKILAYWSFGVVIVRSCGLTMVTAIMAKLTGKKESNMRQCLREWYWNKEDKAGAHRQEIEVTKSYVPLLRWVLSWWPKEEKRMMIAMDATTLGERYTVLAISVVYRGCAIPIAWKIVVANKKKAWKQEWLILYEIIQNTIPGDWLVIVLADRGLYADWLFHAICKIGWHPFLRINMGGKYRLDGKSEYQELKGAIKKTDKSWAEKVVCFKHKPLKATLLASWDEKYEEPWLILTDLEPEQAQSCWYSMRSWVECGFKQTKRGGWQWQNTRMTDPDRASRLWLVIAVATLWAVSVGGEADAGLPASSLGELAEIQIVHRTATKRSTPRLLSCFKQGIIHILAALILNQPLPLGRFIPESWPGT